MKIISAPSPAEAMCTTGSMPDVRLTGSGSLDNSLKASRSRMRAMTSNCLPSDLESDPEMVRISSITSMPRISVKARWIA